MTKSELIARLAQRYPQLVAKDAEYAVKMILDAMTNALLAGNRIEIRGFGSFGLNYRPPRVGRNPKSGEKVHVPEKYVPHFKAGKELRERVDRADANASALRAPAKTKAPLAGPAEPLVPTGAPRTVPARPEPHAAQTPAQDPDATIVMPPRLGRAASN
jgi:integration host factor subunit beta